MTYSILGPVLEVIQDANLTHEMPFVEYLNFSDDHSRAQAMNWCHSNCTGSYKLGKYTVRFEKRSDFVAFKLVWQ